MKVAFVMKKSLFVALVFTLHSSAYAALQNDQLIANSKVALLCVDKSESVIIQINLPQNLESIEDDVTIDFRHGNKNSRFGTARNVDKLRPNDLQMATSNELVILSLSTKKLSEMGKITYQAEYSNALTTEGIPVTCIQK